MKQNRKVVGVSVQFGTDSAFMEMLKLYTVVYKVYNEIAWLYVLHSKGSNHSQSNGFKNNHRKAPKSPTTKTTKKHTRLEAKEYSEPTSRPQGLTVMGIGASASGLTAFSIG